MTSNAIHRGSGFSLVEVMVAVVVMAIVTSQLLISFSQQHTTSLEHERTIEIQEEARLVVDVMLRDLRVGGFMVPKYAAVASTDGGAAGSDALCISDASVIADASLTDQKEKFPGAELDSVVGGGSGIVTFPTAELDIDGDGDVDFLEDGGIIIGTGTRGHCAEIESVTAGASTATIRFTPSTLVGFTAAPGDSAVPAVRYVIDGAGNFTRNTVTLSSHVEDIQAEFGVDIDRNGTIEGAEFPIDNLDTEEYELVRNVRIQVTAREARTELGFQGQFPAVANRVAGAADNFKRRRVTGDAILRNLR